MIGFGGNYGYGSYGNGSITGWENSYYGGYMRLIRDYPYVRIPNSIDHEEGEVKSKLPWFESSKLRQMFLNLVKKHGYSDVLLDAKNSKVVTKTKYNYLTFTNDTEEVIEITAKPEDIEYVRAKICKKEPELGPLFEHFKDCLSNSKFSVTIPPKDEDQQCQGGGESGDEGDGEDTQQQQQPQQSQQPYSVDENGNLDFESKEKMKEFLDKIQNQANEEMENVSDEQYKGGWSNLIDGEYETIFKEIKRRKNPYKITDLISRGAQRLDRLLDITFDYDKDIVKSLRLGKLDLSKIAEVPAGNLSVYQREMENQSTKPFSVCLLVDESGSMYGGEMTMAKNVTKMIHLSLSNVLPPDKLFIYGHTTNWDNNVGEHAEVRTYQSPYTRDFEYRIDSMHADSGNLDTQVIEKVHEKIRSFTDDRIIMLVISDGQPCDYDPEKHKQICERAKRDDFIIGGIFIYYPGIEDMYNYNVQIHDLKKGPEKVSQLLNKIVKTEFQ